MLTTGLLLLLVLFVLLAAIALHRRDGSLKEGFRRAFEQMVSILPRLTVAFIAAGFVAKLVPTGLVSSYLGAGSGILGVAIGGIVGMLIPAGPVVIFAIAAAFYRSGAAVPALISFITAWALFSAHRIIIFEAPMLGMSFVRLRVISAIALPFLAGLIALMAETLPSMSDRLIP